MLRIADVKAPKALIEAQHDLADSRDAVRHFYQKVMTERDKHWDAFFAARGIEHSVTQVKAKLANNTTRTGVVIWRRMSAPHLLFRHGKYGNTEPIVAILS